MDISWSERERKNYEHLQYLCRGIEDIYLNKMEKNYSIMQQKSKNDFDIFIEENTSNEELSQSIKLVVGERYKIKRKAIYYPLGLLLGKRSEEEISKNKSLLKVIKKYFNYLITEISDEVESFKKVNALEETENKTKLIERNIIGNLLEVQVFIENVFNLLTIEDKCKYLKVCEIIPNHIDISMKEMDREIILTMIGKDEMEMYANRVVFNTTHQFKVLSVKRAGEKNNDNIISILGSHSKKKIEDYVDIITQYLKKKYQLDLENFENLYSNQFEVAQIIKRVSLFKDEKLKNLFSEIIDLPKYRLKKDYVSLQLSDKDDDGVRKVTFAINNHIPVKDIYLNGSVLIDQKLSALRIIFNSMREYYNDDVITGTMYTTKDEHVMEIKIPSYEITNENLSYIKEEIKREIESENYQGVPEILLNKFKEYNLRNILDSKDEEKSQSLSNKKKKI